MRAVIFLALIVIAGCTPRGTLTFAPQAVGIGVAREVFVGTTRGLYPDTGQFDGSRSETVNFGRYVLSIPPDREPGSLTWPPRNTLPDPRKHFLTLEQQSFGGSSDFRSALATSIRNTTRGERDAVVFIHGFNTNFAEGVYRVAQLSQDLNFPGVTVHYSWPSKGDALSYVYDRDSVQFARDGLEALLVEVAAAGAERILLFGHSMGAGLAMEALRQSAIRGDRAILDRVGGVVLISPDIDVDVFRMQAQTIGKLRQPITVFTSRRDRALAVAAVVAREQNRLGNLADVTRLADLDVTLMEVGAFSRGMGHLTVGTSPTLIALLNRIGEIDAALDGDARRNIGLLPGAVLTVQGATRIILSPVVGLSSELNK